MTDEKGVDPSDLRRTAVEIAASYRRSTVRTGDLVISIGPSYGKVMVVPPELTGANLTQGTARVAVNRDIAHPRFVFWVLRSTGAREYWDTRCGGATFAALNLGPLGETPVSLPHITEQRARAAFLDRKTAAIDTLIAKKERQIELLGEKRQALITQAVTKGIDPDAKMKDSGIESLGKIPAHWTVLPFRRFIDRIEQGWSPVAEDRQAIEGEWAVLKLSAVSKGRFRPEEHKALAAGTAPDTSAEVRPGDLLLTRANTPELVGESCAVMHTPPRLMLPDLIYRITLTPGLLQPQFTTYFLQSTFGRGQITADARGSSQSMVKIGGGHIRSWTVPVPPMAEQIRIVNRLDVDLSQIERVSHRLHEQLSKIKEYRQALISAAVTGKIEIPTKEAA